MRDATVVIGGRIERTRQQERLGKDLQISVGAKQVTIKHDLSNLPVSILFDVVTRLL